MEIYEIAGVEYRLRKGLSDFQLKMYVHLINWKWANLTLEPGYFGHEAYDALLPDMLKEQYYPLYRSIVYRFLNHKQKYAFKLHRHFFHMASSQAACANLFLPILQDPQIAVRVFRTVKTDLKEIATDHLDKGFRLEFWDEPDNALNDHNKVTGTDVDIAIAYYDVRGNLNLWLIEHKLTEAEFTTCGGFKSTKQKPPFACEPASAIIDDKSLCYYHGKCGYRYWDITLQTNSPLQIDRMREYKVCPFKGGMNQLWRNQLLATAVESSTSPHWPYKKVFLSVVYHSFNHSLEPTIAEYQKLIGFDARFSAFTSDRLLNRAGEISDPVLQAWVRWYQELYYL